MSKLKTQQSFMKTQCKS